MITSKTKYLAFAALAAMLAGCSNDEDFAPQESLKDTPITVNVGVTELTSRAGYEGTTSLPETFYLSIDQDGEKYDYTNVKMTKTEGSYACTSETQQLLWAGDSAVSVTAATFSLDGAQTLEVKTNQSTNDAVIQSDHLYYTNSTVTPSKDGINVNFSHIMSKVVLTITLGDEFNKISNPITNVKFKGTVARNSYDFTAETPWGTIAEGTEATDITPFFRSYKAIDTEEGITNAKAEYEVILVPQTVATGGFAVQFNVGDRIFNWTSASENGVNLESGHKYILELTAGKDKVSSASFSVSNWGTGNDNGKLETE